VDVVALHLPPRQARCGLTHLFDAAVEQRWCRVSPAWCGV